MHGAAQVAVSWVPAGTTVTVTTTVTFASLWLVPRLSEFRERHPEVSVHVAADSSLRDLERDRLAPTDEDFGRHRHAVRMG